jgi:hypothetical protein
MCPFVRSWNQIIEEVQEYVHEKVKPTAQLLNHVREVGMSAGEAALEQSIAVGYQAKAAAATGVELAATAAELGIEGAQRGMETLGEASARGMEMVGEAVEFGKGKALEAARTPLGQMAAERLDEAAVMADAMAEAYVPGDMAQLARRGDNKFKRKLGRKIKTLFNSAKRWNDRFDLPTTRPSSITIEKSIKKINKHKVFWN